MLEFVFPGRLHHDPPRWIPDSAIFHIRIRAESGGSVLTRPDLAPKLLDSAAFYTKQGRWWAWLFLLMPDHLHALISFPRTETMSDVIGDWKRYHARQNAVGWQDGYFDHRLRSTDSFTGKAT